jgi:multiple sugar transport system substrate-binding protein
MLSALALVFVLLVAGCSQGSTGNEGNGEGQEAKKQDVKLTFWIFENPPMVDQTKKLLKDFENANPNIKVDLQVFPNNQYNDKLLVALGTETGPDVLLASDRTMPALTSKKVLAPVLPKSFGFNSLDEMKENWISGSLAGLSQDGQLYGVPMEFNTFSLFINTKAFKDAGLDPATDAPKTWEELASVAKKLTIRKDGKLVQAGFGFPMFNGGWDLLVMDPMVRQLGGTFIKDYGNESYYNSPQVKQVFQTWYDLYFTHKVNDMGFGTSTTANPNQSFIDGKVAMWLSGPWAIPQITEGTPAYSNYAVVPLPQYNPSNPVTMLYSWNWAVNNATKHKEESWALVNFLSSQQTKWLESSGYIQPRKGWMDTPEFKKFPFGDVWVKEMEKGSYIMRSEQYSKLADITGRAVDAVMKDGASIDEALQKAQTEAENALKNQ